MTTRYFLLHGDHIETSPEGRERHYRAPTDFASKTDDLHERWPEKFRKVDGAYPPPSYPGGQTVQPSTTPNAPETVKPPAELRQMTLKQLQDWAAGEEIDLRGAKSAPEALKTIETALKG